MSTFAEREFIVAGPPGCGKSTYVMSQAARAVEKYGRDAVMVCSMTKAAANEIALRNACMNPDMVGTIHSHCFRGLGKPHLAETRENLKNWNEYHQNCQISLGAASSEEDCGVREYGDVDKTPGSGFLQEVNLLRAKGTPEEVWRLELRRFYKLWTDWKAENELLDFADLIDEAKQRLFYAPGNPAVIFVDEAQDISRAEYELIRQWGSKVRQCVIVGDRDQSLYHWRGADSSVVDVSRLPSERVRVLAQSYRVPRAVHKEALRVISYCADRVPVEYSPVDKEGFVVRSSATLQDLSPVMEYIESDKTVMILASCSYMLNGVVKFLKDAGIPYGNPYSDRWNPPQKRNQQLYAYLAPSEMSEHPTFWSVDDFKLITSDMRAKGVFIHGKKQEIADLDPRMSPQDLAFVFREVFEPEALATFMSFDLDAFVKLYPERISFESARKILARGGREALVDIPRITVGTIHSVKGGEADVVILAPDLSAKGYLQSRRRGWGGGDSVLRMFYVGITRAREGVVFCSPSNSQYESRV